jgi:hypothetical protein
LVFFYYLTTSYLNETKNYVSVVFLFQSYHFFSSIMPDPWVGADDGSAYGRRLPPWRHRRGSLLSLSMSMAWTSSSENPSFG